MAIEVDYVPKHFVVNENFLPRIGDIAPYVFDNNIKIAVDIALTTGRPLLVAGAPGSGKSRLAEAMAAVLDWNYLNYTITSRTRTEDLMADYDHLQRLHDAHTRTGEQGMKPDWAYFKPGLFWWAFNKESAARRGGSEIKAKELEVVLDYPGKLAKNQQHTNKNVLLIDEIDKAEPDLANDLLEPLDRRRLFDPSGKLVEASPGLEILTIITTNGERELPSAFMRRCVTLLLTEPDEAKLQTIARYHFSKDSFGLDEESFSELIKKLAAKIVALRAGAEKQYRRPVSTSEFLDAVNAAAHLKKGIGDDVWKRVEQSIEQSILTKSLTG
jgi:MoxR-like ATPase